MDISNLATKNNADAGVWFTVQLYGKEQDFQVKLLGDDSDVVEQYLKEKLKRSMEKRAVENGEKHTVSQEDIDNVFIMEDEHIAVRIADIRGIKRDDTGTIISYDDPILLHDRIITNKREDIVYLIRQIPELKRFVSRISTDRKHFLSNRKESLKQP